MAGVLRGIEFTERKDGWRLYYRKVAITKTNKKLFVRYKGKNYDRTGHDPIEILEKIFKPKSKEFRNSIMMSVALQTKPQLQYQLTEYWLVLSVYVKNYGQVWRMPYSLKTGEIRLEFSDVPEAVFDHIDDECDKIRDMLQFIKSVDWVQDFIESKLREKGYVKV